MPKPPEINDFGKRKWLIINKSPDWPNGMPHRKDGPAEEYSDGYKIWWENGDILLKNITRSKRIL